MPVRGEYMGMMLTIDDVDKENREFFKFCAKINLCTPIF